MQYTIYNQEGRITHIVGSTPEDIDAEVAAVNGSGYIEGSYSWSTYWINQGQPVEFSTNPDPKYKWDWTSKDWTDPRTLEQAKFAKNLEINKSRAEANSSTFTFGGKQIAADDLSMKDIQSVNGDVQNYGSFAAGWPGVWKAVDNTYVLIQDVTTWHQFYRAMVQQGTVNFIYSQQLKGHLAAATTLAQVDAINWA